MKELKSTTNVESLLDLDSRRYIKLIVWKLEIVNTVSLETRVWCALRGNGRGTCPHYSDEGNIRFQRRGLTW